VKCKRQRGARPTLRALTQPLAWAKWRPVDHPLISFSLLSSSSFSQPTTYIMVLLSIACLIALYYGLNFGCRPHSNLKVSRPCSRPRRRPLRSCSRPASVCPPRPRPASPCPSPAARLAPITCSLNLYWLRECHANTRAPSCTDRVQRLKDARAEAGKEIDEYKKTKEDEFKKFEQSVRTPIPFLFVLVN
jgi:hypothetical protein